VSEAPEQEHKPYLIDPREEGTRPPGIDGWWLIQLSAVQFSFLARRFPGLPPLFYPIAFAGLISGLPALATAIIQVTTTRTPLPLWLNASSILSAGLLATAGVFQGIGTLYCRRWGLAAVYTWLVLAWAMGLVMVLGVPAREDRDISGGDVFALVVLLVQLVVVCVYYHNRRAVFGTKAA
jgi:hypothetical protein